MALFGLGPRRMAALSGLLGWPIARIGSHHALARAVSLVVGCVSDRLGVVWAIRSFHIYCPTDKHDAARNTPCRRSLVAHRPVNATVVPGFAERQSSALRQPKCSIVGTRSPSGSKSRISDFG